jgi:1-acyl-sn-glycerol-3-phosphate acyltransferase
MFENIWYQIGRFLVRLFARSIFELSIDWKSPIPHGPVILAANHPSTVDPALITTLTQDQVSVLIRETLFKVPLFGRSLRACGHIEVIQGDGQAALKQAQALLAAGRTVAIFPEGEISPLEGGYHRPHTGLARLAMATGAPVIPVGIHLDPMQIRQIRTRVDHKIEVGTWYMHGSYAMTVGQAVHIQGDAEDHAAVRQVSDDLMDQIIVLSKESAKRIAINRRMNWFRVTRWWLWSPVRLIRCWDAFDGVTSS